MRIAVVSPFVDRRHGTERALAELLERLARSYSCEVHLFSQRVDDVTLAHSSLRRAEQSAGIFWHRVPSLPGPHVLQFAAWLAFNRLARFWHGLLHHRTFDIVLSPGVNCLDADVIIVHALFHRLTRLSRDERPGVQPGFLRGLHRRAYYRLLTKLERRIYSDKQVSLAAVSPRTAAHLREYFHRDNILVVQNGVDAARFSTAQRLARRHEARSRRNLSDADFLLLLIGNDWHAKGASTILAALALCRDFPLRALFVGDDPDAASFREFAKSLKVLDRCHWERSTREVNDLYAAADVYASPSFEDSFALPVAEAMASGLPVITSVCAGVSAYIRDGLDGFVLADPRDAGSLAKIIRMLYEQPDLRARMGAAAAKITLAWTWDRNAEEIWELLKHAAHRTKG